MRILYFSRDYCPHDHRILTAIVAGGHEAHYLRLEDAGRNLESRSIPDGVHPIQWRGGTKKFHWYNIPSLALSMKEVLIDVRPDLMHVGPIQSAGMVGVLSGFHPLVSMSWGFDLMQDAGKNVYSRWVTRNVLHRSDWLFGDCQAVLNKAADFGYNPARSSLFPWGVDLKHFSPGDGSSIRKQCGWMDETILFCNRSWEPQYGVDMVARAFVQASNVNPHLRLLLLGSGSQKEKIEQILREGGVLDKVVFPGQVPNADLPAYYRAADLYISASHTDGSSVSLMEALACGLPAAVSNIPPNLEWVRPDEEGWLFKDGSVEELSALMLRLDQEKVNLAVMRIKARRKAERSADWEINQRKMLAGYEQAVKK
jgi:glycosyltransferase involved in cell wall biosynthesis